MIRAQRFEYILWELKTKGIVSIVELTHALNASRSTIHRDLYDLEQQNQLKCIRGGAEALESTKASFEPAYSIRQDFFTEEKQRIAKAALEFIQPNDTIILDGGTTVLELTKLLTGCRDLHVATNDLHEAMVLADNPQISLILLGGLLRTSHYTLNGMFTEEMLRKIHADTTFLSVDAVDLEVGLMGFSVEELQTKHLMVRASQKTIVLCDHSKFESIAFANICPLAEVDMIITGKELKPDILERLEKLGLKVLTV